MKLLKPPKKKNFQRMKYQYLQDEGVDCSSLRTRAFLQDVKLPKGFPNLPMEFPEAPNIVGFIQHIKLK